MNDKIVVLNSGGFDSVCLMNFVREKFPSNEIHSLFFNYGQRNLKKEKEMAIKVAKKVNAVFYEIFLPPFSWTKGTFYKEVAYTSNMDNYIEMRNLVFFSYAISYAESIKAKGIYAAVLKSLGYTDTCLKFLYKVQEIAKLKDIDFNFPFSEYFKEDLYRLVLKYKITPQDFFSCNFPDKENNSCGECPDCVTLKYIYSSLYPKIPIHAFLDSGTVKDPLFKKLFMKTPITEIRVQHNNKCQLHCKHCYYGFDKMKGKELTREEFKKVFKQCDELGINAYHFSGKEPLFDSSVFDLVSDIRGINPVADISLVTNGINVPKFINELKNCRLSKLCLSVDDVSETNGVRTVKNVTDKALTALQGSKIPVEIFIDLHKNNFNKVNEIIHYLYTTYGLRRFYIRTIIPFAHLDAKDIKGMSLNTSELNKVYLQLLEVANSFTDVSLRLTIHREYTWLLQQENMVDMPIIQAFNNQKIYGESYVLNNFEVYFEQYCGRYENQISITPDGYILGCASEMSCSNYDEVSVGNVLDTPLEQLIYKGKTTSLADNKILEETKCTKCFCCKNRE